MAGSYNEVQICSNFDAGRLLVIDVQSTTNIQANIQDNVFQDKAGGFSYQHNRKFGRTTRNRSIFWKVSQNCIYLTEVSQDLHLFGNQLKLVLKNFSVLPNVSIHETATAIYLVIATSHSVHRLMWPHPVKEKQGCYISANINASSESIFCNNPKGLASQSWCFASLQKKCHSFAAHQSQNGECLVSLVGFDGSLIFVKLPPPNVQAQPQIHELKQTGIMKRLWTGFIPTVLRGDDLPHDSVQVCEIHTFENHSFIFTLCKDLKIRIWSCKSLDCVEEYDLTPSLPDVLDAQSGLAQAHMIRKAVDDETDIQYVAVFLNFQFQSQFFAFEVTEDDDEVEISLLSSHFSKLTSLLDFCLTSNRIWALWASATGDNVLQYACIEEGEGSSTTWQNVSLQSDENSRVFVHHSTEPKDVYMNNLFMPGRFSKNVILKTVQMTMESFDEKIELKITANSTINEMRAAVENLVNYQLINFTADQDLDPEEYYNLQMQCWSNFFASAVQYDQVERKPLGLFAERSSGLAIVIRQNYRGYLTSNTWLEKLYQQDNISEESYVQDMHDEAGIIDRDVASDILALVECIRSTSMQFAENTFRNLESSVANNDDVNEICAALAKDLFTDASDSVDFVGDAHFTANFIRNVQLKLKDRQNLFEALNILIDAMDPVKWLPADFEKFDEELQVFSVNSSHSFTSKEGRTIVTESIYNRARLNMEICRDCLLLVDVLICMGASAGVYDDKRAILESMFVPRLHALLRSYFTVIWMRRNTFSSDDSDVMESNLKKFATLELVDGGGALKKSKWDDLPTQSILHYFVNDVAISNSLNVFARLPVQAQKGPDANRPWNYDFKIISDMIFRSLWPCRDGTELPEFLFSQGQASLLSEYLFICSDWCRNNCGSREFLTGQAYLQNGDHEKARQHFFKATKFIGQGEDLLSRLISDEETEKPKRIISYFIMIMRLFEQFDNPEMMIVVATAAIFLAKNSKSKEVAMLWSNTFKCHLQLGHIKEAYQAVVLNPDKQRRRNCLHNFVVTLCERKQFQELCSFSYSSLEDEVVNIIETRARTVDITVNDYYDILFAFHSFRSDMRRAATAMYEYACRLQTEMHGLASLQQQAKCYLAAINSLRICEEKFAWIVRPVEKTSMVNGEEESFSQGRSPKRKEDGEEVMVKIVDRKKGTKKTVIVELSDLEKEYLLIVARLNLLQFDKCTATVIGPNLSATEILPLLCQAGLFDRAFAVALAFKIDLDSIFEAIASKCVRVSSDASQGIFNDDAFEWLKANDPGSSQSINDVSAVEQGWRLLRNYLTKFTSVNVPIYHKAVATKLLSLGCNLPIWFVNDYKRRNPGQLLRIYTSYDLLEEAGELAIEYINAVLGIGKESFGIEHAVHATSPAVWLPYSALDHLLKLLKDSNKKSNLNEVFRDLAEKLEQYFNTVRETSNDQINLAYKRRNAMVTSTA